MAFLDNNGNYYTGEKMPGDISVLPRPSSAHVLKADYFSHIPDVWELDTTALKKSCCSEIDKHTADLIVAGFTFADKQFSLSDNAQRKLLILQNLIVMGALDPFTPMSALDESVYSLPRAQAQAFVAAGYARLSSLIQSGTELKGQIMDASTEEAVNAVADTRE